MKEIKETDLHNTVKRVLSKDKQYQQSLKYFSHDAAMFYWR